MASKKSQKATLLFVFALLSAIVVLFFYFERSSSRSSQTQRSIGSDPRVEGDNAPNETPRPPVTLEEDRAADTVEPSDQDSVLYPVDLDALRRALPDNLYWTLGAPTEDTAVLEKRRVWKQEMQALKGKIVSGTGTEEEIDAYFARRRRRSQDYIAFVDAALSAHEGGLPERDLGLYLLSRSMHEKRLDEIEKERTRAYERLALQNDRRREWRGEANP